MQGGEERVSDEERQLFDELLEQVLDALPPSIHALLEEVPLVVDDQPSPQIMAELGIEDPAQLCGLHTGIPLTERSVQHSGDIPDIIHIFRDGILELAAGADGYVDERQLSEQIRITVLHEIGHHFGLDEDKLEELGYG